MKTRRAFTLVEILVVIAIIGILVTLVTVAVAGAMRAGKRARIGVEMNQIAMALEHSKAEFGEYPPDLFDDAALVRYVKKRWPRYELPQGNVNSHAAFIRASINVAYGNSVDFTAPGSKIGSLVLWLGGLPNPDGKLSGFHADPENPFFLITPSDTTDGAIPIGDRVYDKKVFVDWELGEGKRVRFVKYDNNDHYVPVVGTEIQDTFVPFVYFRGKAEGGSHAYDAPNENTVKSYNFGTVLETAWSSCGVAAPYIQSAKFENGVIDESTIIWNNPTTYQLIHPGLDGIFGSEPVRVITGTGISAADLDNITNFSDYKELKSILP